VTEPDPLLDIGLRPGDVVRFRPRPSARWVEATVERRERDGSVGVRDPAGRARALPIDRLEVPAHGPRGAATWEPLADRAAREVQLDLLRDTGAPETPGPARRRGRGR
jgi:hypothetical protein